MRASVDDHKSTFGGQNTACPSTKTASQPKLQKEGDLPLSEGLPHQGHVTSMGPRMHSFRFSPFVGSPSSSSLYSMSSPTPTREPPPTFQVDNQKSQETVLNG